jgi:hypothetical protein
VATASAPLVDRRVVAWRRYLRVTCRMDAVDYDEMEPAEWRRLQAALARIGGSDVLGDDEVGSFHGPAA